jgi:hypothetical protein
VLTYEIGVVSPGMLGVPHPETLPSPRATPRSIRTFYWARHQEVAFSGLVAAVLGVLRRQIFGIRQASCPQRAHTNAKQGGTRQNAEDHRRAEILGFACRFGSSSWSAAGIVFLCIPI